MEFNPRLAQSLAVTFTEVCEEENAPPEAFIAACVILYKTVKRADFQLVEYFENIIDVGISTRMSEDPTGSENGNAIS